MTTTASPHAPASTDRYTIISADGHCGADLLEYRPYLESRWLDDFDAWATAFVNPAP